MLDKTARINQIHFTCAFPGITLKMSAIESLSQPKKLTFTILKLRLYRVQTLEFWAVNGQKL